MMPELVGYDHGLSSLPMQNPYSKLILGITSLQVRFINLISMQFFHKSLHTP